MARFPYEVEAEGRCVGHRIGISHHSLLRFLARNIGEMSESVTLHLFPALMDSLFSFSRARHL